MNYWFLIINFFSVFTIMHCQTWAGKYRWASSCNQTACCCGSGTLNITQISSTVLGVITGANSLCPVPVIYENLVNISGYTIYQQQPFGTVVWTLSSDSQSLTLGSSSFPSACNDGAVKSSANSFTHLFRFMSILVTGSLWIKQMHF
jgi:hypothetical protein